MIKPENILIVRTDRIGDVILSLPMAGLIKKRFPGCRVTFLLGEYTKELAEDHPFVDEVLILKERDKKILLKSNVTMLKKKSFDVCIVVSPTFLTVLMVFLAGIKIRIGSGYRWYSFLLNKKIFEHRKYASKHELEFNIDLLKAIDVEEKVSEGNVKFNLQARSLSIESVKNILEDSNVDPNKKIIIVHPGSGGSAIDLPVEKFSELVNKITQLKDVSVIITGSKTEFDICNAVKGSSNAVNLAGKFTLSEIVALISMCSLFTSNSTGPIHISAALGKSTIGFYPKILVCSPQRWGPYTTKKAVFSPKIECNDCTREQCEKMNCMNSIDIDNVMKTVVKFLA